MVRNKVILGLAQMRMETDREKNLQKALGMIGKAASKGAQIVCLPELFTSPYFAQVQGAEGKREAEACAESVPGKTTRALSEAAAENKVVLVGGSVYEKAGGRLYNTSAAFDEKGRMLGKYRKIHIPHDECFFEQDYFSAGNLGFSVFRTKRARIAPLICYDQWFPEAARSVALMGAQIAFYPTAIATLRGMEQAEGSWQQAWENVMRGHAIANGMIVAAVNRCGQEGRMNFWGGSFICDAFGKTIARAGSTEKVLVAEVDLAHSEMVRKGWRFFDNRKPAEYRKITEERK
jgi:agmatine deiminase